MGLIRERLASFISAHRCAGTSLSVGVEQLAGKDPQVVVTAVDKCLIRGQQTVVARVAYSPETAELLAGAIRKKVHEARSTRGY